MTNLYIIGGPQITAYVFSGSNFTCGIRVVITPMLSCPEFSFRAPVDRGFEIHVVSFCKRHKFVSEKQLSWFFATVEQGDFSVFIPFIKNIIE